MNKLTITYNDKSYELREGNDKDHPYFWLENEQGEGMDVREDELFNLLDKYFQKEF